MTLLEFWLEHRGDMLALFVQHLTLVIAATGLATAIGVPLGVVAVRRRRIGLRTLSDAAPVARGWRAGFGYEFLERADGFRGLARRYGLELAAPPRVMDLGLSYRALASGEVDLIAGDATAGLVAALDLVMLEDDLEYFPPYDAAPVARSAVLLRHPEVGRALAGLAGRITERDMRVMNAAVDLEKRDPARVVRDFLARVDSRPTASAKAPARPPKRSPRRRKSRATS